MLSRLLAHPGVVEDVVLAGPVGVMALHGGIEEGTAAMARDVAMRSGASLYVVEQPPDLAWHLPSTAYDPAHSAGLRRFLAHVRWAISLHGFGRRHLPETVLVGGRNRALRHQVAQALSAHCSLRVLTDVERMPPGLRGLHPLNPVNRPPRGGVQLELSPSARRPGHREDVTSALVGVAGSGEPARQGPPDTLPRT